MVVALFSWKLRPKVKLEKIARIVRRIMNMILGAMGTVSWDVKGNCVGYVN
jgi:hypothetical protein